MPTDPHAARPGGLPTPLSSALASALAGHPHHARMARAWQALLGLLLVVILLLALAPAPPETVDLGWDKLNHLAAFATLSVVAALALARARWQIALGLLAYGGLIEVLQSFTPNRQADGADLLADAVGIAVGLALVALAARSVAGGRVGEVRQG